MYSWVGPAVMSSRPREGAGAGAASAVRKKSAACLKISSGSSILPFPTSAEASSPSPGSMMPTPLRRSVSRFSCVAGWAYMSKSMAGATMTGAFIERYVVRSILSAMPCAIFANVDADAGAMSMRSAHVPKSTWLCQLPSRRSKNSLTTPWRLSVARVRGVTNSLAEGVMTTCTSAPALTKRRTKVQAL